MNPGRAILEDPAASDWLKRAVLQLGQRDPVDVLHDVQALLEYAEWLHNKGL